MTPMLEKKPFYILPSGKAIACDELELQFDGTTIEQATNYLAMQMYSEEDILAMLELHKE